MAKLTVNADAEVIEQAKRIARERGITVSAMFSQFVRTISQEEPSREAELGPVTRKALGLVSLPTGQSDRELIEEALAERYG